MSKKPKVYIIHSEYVQHGLTFNSETRYTIDLDKANRIYEDVLNAMKADYKDMVADKESYKINKFGRKTTRFYTCFYKYQPEVSNFSVEMTSETLE